MHAYIQTYIHTKKHTYIHTYINTYIHTYIHTYTHGKMRPRPQMQYSSWTAGKTKYLLKSTQNLYAFLRRILPQCQGLHYIQFCTYSLKHSSTTLGGLSADVRFVHRNLAFHPLNECELCGKVFNRALSNMKLVFAVPLESAHSIHTHVT